MAYKNKIKKTIRLYPETYEMVEAYRGQTGEDFTNGLESLVIKGLENNNTSQLLFKKLKNEVNKLTELQKLSTDRLTKILISQTRILGEIKALSKVHILKSGLVEVEEVEEYIKKGIKSAFRDLQKREVV